MLLLILCVCRGRWDQNCKLSTDTQKEEKVGQKQDLAASRGDVSSFSFSSSARLWNKKRKKKNTQAGGPSIKKRFPGRKHSLTCAGGNHRQRRRSPAAVCRMKSEGRTCSRLNTNLGRKYFYLCNITDDFSALFILINKNQCKPCRADRRREWWVTDLWTLHISTNSSPTHANKKRDVAFMWQRRVKWVHVGNCGKELSRSQKVKFWLTNGSLVPSLSRSLSLSLLMYELIKCETHEVVWGRLLSVYICSHSNSSEAAIITLAPYSGCSSTHTHSSKLLRILVVEQTLSAFSYRRWWFCSHGGTLCGLRNCTWEVDVNKVHGTGFNDMRWLQHGPTEMTSSTTYGGVKTKSENTTVLNESQERPCIYSSCCLCSTILGGVWGGMNLNSP